MCLSFTCFLPFSPKANFNPTPHKQFPNSKTACTQFSPIEIPKPHFPLLHPLQSASLSLSLPLFNGLIPSHPFPHFPSPFFILKHFHTWPSPLFHSSMGFLGFWPCLAALFFISLHTHLASSALILSLKHHYRNSDHHNRRPMLQANQTGCALFAGTWVRDDSYPLYQASNCPFIDPEFNCQAYGRPDSNYLKYRWQPLDCELPRSGIENPSLWNLSLMGFFCFFFLCIYILINLAVAFSIKGSMGLSFWWEWEEELWCLLVIHWGETNGSHWFVWSCHLLLKLLLKWLEENLFQPSDSWWVATLNLQILFWNNA